NAHAGDFGGDGLERAANLGRRIRFWVPRIKLAGTAGEPDEDYSFPICSARGSAAQQIRQRQTGQARHTPLEEPAARADVDEVGGRWLEEGGAMHATVPAGLEQLPHVLLLGITLDLNLGGRAAFSQKPDRRSRRLFPSYFAVDLDRREMGVTCIVERSQHL